MLAIIIRTNAAAMPCINLLAIFRPVFKLLQVIVQLLKYDIGLLLMMTFFHVLTLQFTMTNEEPLPKKVSVFTREALARCVYFTPVNY